MKARIQVHLPGILLAILSAQSWANEGITRVLFDSIPFGGLISEVQQSSDRNWLIGSVGEPGLGDAWVFSVEPDQRMSLRTDELVHSVCVIPRNNTFAVAIRRTPLSGTTGEAKLEIRSFDAPHQVLRTIPVPADYLYSLTVCSSGKRMAFWSLSQLKVVDLEHNTMMCTIPLDKTTFSARVSWSTDGEYLAVAHEWRQSDRRNVAVTQWRVSNTPEIVANFRGDTMGTVGYRQDGVGIGRFLAAWPDAQGVRVTTLDGVLVEHHRTERYAQCEYALSGDCKKLLVWGYNGRDLQVHHLGTQERPSEWRGVEGERITSARFDVSGRGVLIASHTFSRARQYRINHWLWQQ